MMPVEYVIPASSQSDLPIVARRSSVSISNKCALPYLEIKSTFGGTAELSSSYPSALTTIEGVPVSADVLVRYRSAVAGSYGDGMLVAKATSTPAGEWSISGLNSALRYDVYARLMGENDALQSGVEPFDFPRFSPSEMKVNIGIPFDKALPILGGKGVVTANHISGAFPDGITLDGQLIHGVWPTGNVGAYPVVFELQDEVGKYQAVLTINLVLLPLVLAHSPMPDLEVGSFSNVQFMAHGGEGPYTYIISSGALPPGLNLDPVTGLLSGIPVVQGAYSFAISATDRRSSVATQAFNVGVVPYIKDYRYFRINVTANNGHPTYVAIAEVELRDASGIDLTSPSEAAAGAATASGYANYANAPYMAFDDDFINKWTSNTSTGWLQYSFPAPCKVMSLAITGHYAGGDQAAFAPLDFTLQGANNPAGPWDTLLTRKNETAWGGAETRVFSLT